MYFFMSLSSRIFFSCICTGSQIILFSIKKCYLEKSTLSCALKEYANTSVFIILNCEGLVVYTATWLK